MFRLDFEKNVPTFFAMLLLLGCGVFAAVGARLAGARGEWKYWAGLAVAFVLVALDEFFSWHEHTAGPIRRALGTSGGLHFAWVIPYGLAMIGLGLLYLRFFLRLEPAFRRRLAVAAVVYLGGALGMEMVGGAYLDGDEARRNFTYGLITTIEETLELTGAVLALRAFTLGFRLQELRLAVDAFRARRPSPVA